MSPAYRSRIQFHGSKYSTNNSDEPKESTQAQSVRFELPPDNPVASSSFVAGDDDDGDNDDYDSALYSDTDEEHDEEHEQRHQSNEQSYFFKRKNPTIEELAESHNFESLLSAQIDAERAAQQANAKAKANRRINDDLYDDPSPSLILSAPTYDPNNNESLEGAEGAEGAAPSTFKAYRSSFIYLLVTLFAGRKKTRRPSAHTKRTTSTAPPNIIPNPSSHYPGSHSPSPPPSSSPSPSPPTPPRRLTHARVIPTTYPDFATKNSTPGINVPPLHKRRNDLNSQLLDREGDPWGRFYAKYPDPNMLPWAKGSQLGGAREGERNDGPGKNGSWWIEEEYPYVGGMIW